MRCFYLGSKYIKILIFNTIQIVVILNVDVYFEYTICIPETPNFQFSSPVNPFPMAFSKAPQFHPLTFKQSFWSKALSHPARIIILTHLLAHGETPFHALAKLIPLAKTTVSQHLRILRQAGLVESYEVYPHTIYILQTKICKDLAIQLENLNQSFTSFQLDASSLPIQRSQG